MSKQETFTLFKTENFERIEKAIAKAVRNRTFLAITAAVGSGKTTAFKYYSNHWKNNPDIICISLKAFSSRRSRIYTITELLIDALGTEERPPAAMEKRYHFIEKLLGKARKAGKKVIIAYDGAENLNLETVRDLKKLHEVSANYDEPLFSIILFGEPGMKKFLRTQELGGTNNPGIHGRLE